MNKEEKEARHEYDIVADKYHNDRTKTHHGPYFYNELLEMPATMGLLGNIRGKKILDGGCGTGIYAKLLTKRGAKVSGFDISPKMLGIAKKENPKLDLRTGSWYKIPFDEKFDVVLAALTLSYLKDWDSIFKEVKRILKNKGIFVFSIGNPVSESAEKIIVKGKSYRLLGNVDYFSEKVFYKWNDREQLNGKIVRVRNARYPKTYEKIIKTIIKNGFEIVDYKDAFPKRGYERIFPDEYRRFTKIPLFCVWKVKKI